MKSITELLDYSANRLQRAGLADPRRESVSLMTFAISRDHAFVRGHPEYELSADEQALFSEIVERRVGREPYQQITERQEFFGLEFEVNKDVLIPRPETELVVETGIEILKDSSEARICDVGTGSGCIPIAMLASLPLALATAIDISPEALAVAARNAQRHNVSSRMSFVASDLLLAIHQKQNFDLIVSNPPYVPKRDLDGLQAEVRDFEPAIALTDGFDGLSIYRRLIGEVPSYLKNGGWLVFEIGIYQLQSILEMFLDKEWKSVGTKSDLQGIPRVISACLR